MSTLQFPHNPNVGDTYDWQGFRYVYDGEKWKTTGVGYNPVNALRDELVPMIDNLDGRVSVEEQVSEILSNTITTTFKSEYGYSAVDNMIAGRVNGIAGAVVHSVGNIYSTGGTTWEYKGYVIGTIADFEALNPVSVRDFGAKADGLTDDSPAFIAVAALGMPIDVPFGTYLLAQPIELIEPFDLRGNNSYLKINHAGVGFHVKSSNYSNKINLSSIKDVNFIASTVNPSILIKIGVESLLEPTNIEIDGVHFRACKPTVALIENERSYGLKLTNGAINECLGVGIIFRSSTLGGEAKFSYNCYIDQFDITGIATGIVIEGGKISISDSVIENCTQSAIKMTGRQYSPVLYCDNIYFENNALTFDCSVESSEGYTSHSRIKDCYFNTNSALSYADAGYTFIIENCKNFNISQWTGSPTFIIGINPLGIKYTPRSGDKQTVIVDSPKRFNKSPLEATETIQVPLISVQRASYQKSASSRICITRTDGTNVGYYEGIFIPTKTDGSSFSITQVAGFSTGGGYPFTPTFSRNSGDPADMALYVTFTGSGRGVVSLTVEGMTGG